MILSFESFLRFLPANVEVVDGGVWRGIDVLEEEEEAEEPVTDAIVDDTVWGWTIAAPPVLFAVVDWAVAAVAVVVAIDFEDDAPEILLEAIIDDVTLVLEEVLLTLLLLLLLCISMVVGALELCEKISGRESPPTIPEEEEEVVLAAPVIEILPEVSVELLLDNFSVDSLFPTPNWELVDWLVTDAFELLWLLALLLLFPPAVWLLEDPDW